MKDMHQIVDLTVECPTVTVLPQANIFAIDMVITPTSCSEPCKITINITYKNGGSSPGGFIPTVTVDGLPTSSSITMLDAGATITMPFIISDLKAGSYTICAEPGDICKILKVQPPIVSAGLPLLIGAGLLVGYFVQKQKECKDYKTMEDCQKNDCQWKHKRCVPYSNEDQFLITKLRQHLKKQNIPSEEIPTCTGEVCIIGKWRAIYRKGKDPIIIKDP